MSDIGAALRDVIEQSAMAGLCREGQLEIALQEARKLRPDLSDDDLIGLAETAYESSLAR